MIYELSDKLRASLKEVNKIISYPWEEVREWPVKEYNMMFPLFFQFNKWNDAMRVNW